MFKKLKAIADRTSPACFIVTISVIYIVYQLINIFSTSLMPIVLDSNLYIDMAKTIFYKLKVEFRSLPTDFGVFYSLFLAPSYFFYNPKSIMIVQRVFGIVAMALSPIPCYFLAKEILQNKWKSILISVISVFLPEMFLSFFIMAESLYYPMSYFAFYFIYLSIADIKKSIGFHSFLGFFIYLLYNCKSIGAVFLLCYLAFICMDFLFNCKTMSVSNVLKKIVPVIVTFLLCYITVNHLISFLNNTSSVTSASLYNGLFSILNSSKIIQLIQGLLFYIYFTIISFYIIPVIIPIVCFSSYNKTDKKFILFTWLFILISWIMIAYLIYMNEQIFRFHFRYFSFAVVPLLILFFKADIKKYKYSKTSILIILLCIAYTLFAKSIDEYRHVTIDSISSYLLAKIHETSSLLLRKVLIIGFLSALLLLLMYGIFNRLVKGSISVFSLIIIAGLMIYNQSETRTFILRTYSNSYFENCYEQSVSLAKYLQNIETVFIPYENHFDNGLSTLDSYLKYPNKFVLMSDLKYDSNTPGRIDLGIQELSRFSYNIETEQTRYVGVADYVVLSPQPQFQLIKFGDNQKDFDASSYFEVYKLKNGYIDLDYIWKQIETDGHVLPNNIPTLQMFSNSSYCVAVIKLTLTPSEENQFITVVDGTNHTEVFPVIKGNEISYDLHRDSVDESFNLHIYESDILGNKLLSPFGYKIESFEQIGQ